jgi:tetratricopeptide (TPR) repeat protein
MITLKTDILSVRTRAAFAGIAMTVSIMSGIQSAHSHEVKDLKYGAVLFEFYQKKYFETLVEYDYAAERGGIHNHGDYPELLKGGVSLSYGLDLQARDIFSKLIAGNTTEEVENRAWFYLAKMLYLRGEIDNARKTMGNIHDVMPHDIDQEYRYLAALINIKQGYFDEAEAISDSFDKNSTYAPYLYFNLGVTLGKQQDYAHAIDNLNKAASYAGEGSSLERLADRAHMAIAYLDAENEKFTDAYAQINHVSSSGVFSNRALLGSGWAYVNSGSYSAALAPLSVLERRSMAIPEVQEAVLLVPHVYEKLGLMGRAANGFISAYDRYGETLEQLDSAKKSLKDADILELFVRNMDEMLGESDWFGTAPSVSLNSLSPFLLGVMSDHSFQSVLKDLRDLYAIRNNLNSWKRKRDDFDVIIKSRSVSLDIEARKQNIKTYSGQQSEHQDAYAGLVQRTANLDKAKQERVQWLLSDLNYEIDCADMMIAQLHDAPGVSRNTDGYAQLVKTNMDLLDRELVRTNKLIDKVENVLIKLIDAELDIHEARMKYYQVQSQLAKVRILDKSLGDLDGPATDEQNGEQVKQGPAPSSNDHKADARGGGDAA